MDWFTKLADYSVPALFTGLGIIAKWVHSMNSRVNEHQIRVQELCEETERCRELCHDTRERIALSEQDRTHLHSAVKDIKEATDKILWHITKITSNGIGGK